MAVKLKISAPQLGVTDSVLSGLGKNSSRAQADALNRTLAGMRTDATRLMVKQSGVKRPEIFRSFTLIKANGRDASPSAAVVIKGRPIPLLKYGARPATPMTGRTRGGVRVRLHGERIRFAHMFVSTMSSGHTGVFSRSRTELMKSQTGKGGQTVRKNRPAIDEEYRSSVPQMADRDDIKDVVMEKALVRFDQRFRQQTRRFLDKSGGKK